MSQADTDKQVKKTPADPIQAAEINLTASNSGPQISSNDSSSSRSPNLSNTRLFMLITLVVCVVLALAVLFVLPKLVAKRQEQKSTPINQQDSSSLPAGSSTDATEQAPVIEQSELLARRAAQDALIRIREKQSALQNKNIQLWATKEFEAAQSLVKKGDSLYQEQLYSKSLDAYKRAETSLDTLEAQVEPRLKQALGNGLAALEQGDADRAMASFRIALAIDATHTEAKEGLERAEVLPELLEYVAQGEQLLKEDSPEAAIIAFERALALDSKHPLPRTSRDRAQQQIDNARYQSAMSTGFNHLNSREYQRAVSAFKQALAVIPGSSEAHSALAEAQARRTEGQIEQLLKQASTSEAQEDWQHAVDNYQQILKGDNTVTEARVGQIRASTRAELDQKMDAMLADPLRLASNKVYRQAGQLLSDAQGIANPGPRLSKQIHRLQQILSTARIPVSLTLESDTLTSVTLLKVGELGTFARKQVELTPGRYVAKGYRQGYRDVRVEFSITAGANPQVVRVQCNESI